MTAPIKLVITSSISAERPMKYWLNSMQQVKPSALSVVCLKVRNLPKASGKKKPSGINSKILGIFSVINKRRLSSSIKKCSGIKLQEKCLSRLKSMGINKKAAKKIKNREQPSPKPASCRKGLTPRFFRMNKKGR